MASHSEVERRLVAYLMEQGFPEEIIVFDPEYRSQEGTLKGRPDIVIVGGDTLVPLAILEVKSELTDDKKDRIRAQVDSYASLFQDVPTYLVTTGSDDSGITFYRYDKKSKEFDELGSGQPFPSLDMLAVQRIAANQAAIVSVQMEQKSTSKGLHWLCFMLASLSILLAIADLLCKQLLNLELLNASRLGLVGAAIGLSLLPFAQKFKGLGFEYERLTHETLPRPSDAKFNLVSKERTNSCNSTQVEETSGLSQGNPQA